MRLFKGILALSLLLFFNGCSPIGPYRVGQEPTQGIHFVEFDESGVAFSQDQMSRGITAADQTLKAGGTVIVYVHGWHHTASEHDEDIPRFERLVASARAEKGEAIGIYVGWRGDSIDVKKWPLFSYALTFWDRKATAHDIGDAGPVAGLFEKLSQSRKHAPEDSRLVIIGHSFGGAIVYSAAKEMLKQQICRDASRLHDACSKLANQGSEVQPDGDSSLADLVVLLNPAFEAKLLEELYHLALTHEYQENLPPRLVMVTTTADDATRYAFRLGRWLATPFRWWPGEESSLNRTAIGHHRPYITHQVLLVASPTQELIPQIETTDNLLSELNTSKRENTKRFEYPPQPGKSFVLTRCDEKNDCAEVADEHHWPKGTHAQKLMPYRFPIANIGTNKSVLKDHVRIWDCEIKWFLYGLLELEPEEFPGIVGEC